MRYIRAAFELEQRLSGVLRQLLWRGAFCEWGRGSRLGKEAKLVGPQLICVGSKVTIGDRVWLNAKDERHTGAVTLTIGDGTYVGSACQINAWGSVVIGCNVLLADRVFISDADHHFEDRSIPIARQGDFFKGPVILEDGCWIGIGAVILPGVTIGRNAVVGANAVVTRSVPPFCVAVGVPARVVGETAERLP